MIERTCSIDLHHGEIYWLPFIFLASLSSGSTPFESFFEIHINSLNILFCVSSLNKLLRNFRKLIPHLLNCSFKRISIQACEVLYQATVTLSWIYFVSWTFHFERQMCFTHWLHLRHYLGLPLHSKASLVFNLRLVVLVAMLTIFCSQLCWLACYYWYSGFATVWQSRRLLGSASIILWETSDFAQAMKIYQLPQAFQPATCLELECGAPWERLVNGGYIFALHQLRLLSWCYVFLHQ